MSHQPVKMLPVFSKLLPMELLLHHRLESGSPLKKGEFNQRELLVKYTEGTRAEPRCWLSFTLLPHVPMGCDATLDMLADSLHSFPRPGCSQRAFFHG